MKRIKLLIILISGFVFSQEAMFNIGSEKNERFSTTLKMNDGSLFVFGQRGNCEGALSPCNGVSQEDNIDPVIYKFNSNLELEWSKEYQREYVDYFLSATVYNNHIYITGSTKTNFNEPTTYDTDFLLLKVDLDGNVVWSKRLGGPCNGAETYCGDVAKKIIINNDIIFVSGIYAFYGTALYDAVILKLNLDGDLIEESVINSGNGSNFFFDAVKTPTGNMLYTGRSKNGGWEPWLYYLDQQNNVLFSNTYGDQSTNADDGFKTIYHNQNFYMLTTYSGQYVNLNKIDLNGNLVWSKKFEGTNARDLLVYNNEIYIAVRNNYQNTLGIIKINTNGSLIQQKQFSYMGGGGYPVKMEIINDQLVIAGTVEYVSNGYDDIYLMTIDPFLNEGPLCLEDNDWGSFYIEENNNVFQAPIGYSEYNITQINNVDLTQNPIVQNLLSNSCGCLDANACNYNPEATISIDVCEYESCTGCTDPEACNYNQEAVEDNGTCEYIEEVDLGEDMVTCEDFVVLDAGEGYGSYLWSTGEDSQTINVSESGNYNVDVVNTLSDPIIETQCGYQSAGLINPDSGILSDEGWMYRDILISENESVYSIFADFYRPGVAESDHDLIIQFYENCDNIFDCENYTFYSLFNYQLVDSSLYQTELLVSDFIDSGSTFFNMGFQTAGPGVLRVLAPLISIEDQWSDLCVTLLTNPTCSNSDNINVTFNICGCVDETACNYNPNAVVAENVCDYESCSGCIDDTACNYDPEATIGANICDYESCSGCIDETACNYDLEAIIGANICDYSCYGCVDPIACNYNPNLTFDDGSCEYIEDVNLGDDVNTCETSFTLNAGAGYGTYSWSTGETSQIIEITESGDYSVEVESGNANNYSMYFDNNDNIEITPENVINELDSYTFNAWVKIDDTNTFQPIFWIGNTDESELEIYTINSFTPAGAGLRVAHKRANPELFNYNIFTPIETSWVFLSVVFNEGLVSVYFNNQEQSILDDGNEILFSNVSVSDIRIGYQDAGSGTQAINLNGFLDEVSFFNNALNHNERENIMNCSPTGDEDGLMGYWNFEEGAEGGQVIDVSGNGNNGNINNATYNDEVPTQECLTNCESTAEINVIFNICGCTDSSADNFNPIASEDDGGCEYLGCMNPSACNFNPTANIDDGTCQLCSSREFNDGAYLDVDSEIINAQGLTISFWVNSDDFCENPSQFSTYIDFGSQETYRYVVRNRSCKIEAFFEGDVLPTDFDWGEMDWGYPKASAAGSLVPNGEQAGWRQVTTVFCPTTIRIYIDGEIVASNGTGVYFQEGFNLFEEDIKRIGSNQIDYEPANAIIDEVRVWNRALSGEEVLARSGTTTTLNTTEELNLNGYWKMDCDNPFLNEITNQQGVESLVVGTNFNENFNNNNCETNIEYNYDCSLDFEGNPDCNSCDPPEGCTDEEACNYDYLAITPINDACFYVPDYCPNLDYPEYYDCDCKCINDIDVDDVCDELEVDGCSEDEGACNYNPEGTELCVFAIDQYPSGLYNCDGICYNDNDPPTNNPSGLGDGVCDEIDNCPETYNPNQTDLNEDGVGDDCDGIGLYENGVTKKLIKIVDVLGREVKETANKTVIIYIYDNGEIIPFYKL